MFLIEKAFMNTFSSTHLKHPPRPVRRRRNLYRQICLALILIAYGINLKAQTPNGYGGTSQSVINLNVGTQGIGADYSYHFNNRTAIRTGVNFIPVKANNLFDVSGFNSSSKLSAKFSNLHLFADYTPFASAPGFRLVGGAGYFFKANGNLEVRPDDGYTYGDIKLTPDQVGLVNMNVNWEGLAPYLGFGILKALPGNRFNVNLDLGAYYLTKPDAFIQGTGLLKGNDSQSDQLESNVSGLRLLPVLQINFNYKL